MDMATDGTTRLLLTVTVISIALAQGVLIEPNIPEITLPSGINYSITCYEKEPVTWTFEEYAATKLNIPLAPYDENVNVDKNKYKSTLSLIRITYLNVGYYYCGPKSVDSKNNIYSFKKIYIYVQDKSHLLMDVNKTLNQNEDGEIIIPCRPTTPNISITLKRNDIEVIKNVHFDTKIGFKFWFFFHDDVNNITCEASNNITSEIHHFLIHRNLNAIHICIQENPKSIVVGQDVTINCTVFTYFENTLKWLKWDLPFEREESDVRINESYHYNPIQSSNNEKYNSTSILLSIKNVTTNDNGLFSCVVETDSGQNSLKGFHLHPVYDLIIWPNITDYVINLNSPENEHGLICKGKERLQWSFINHDGNRVVKKNTSIKVFPTSQNEFKYFSLLSLNKASYLDIGDYYCSPMSAGLESLEGLNPIYVFVEQETHLLAAYENTAIEFYEGLTYTSYIPCLPTSPDVNISIVNDNEDITDEFEFYKKKGFFPNIESSKRFPWAFHWDMKCVANTGRNNITDSRAITNIEESTIHINDGLLYDVVLGKNVTINCYSLSIYSFYYDYHLEWIYPKTLKDKNGNVRNGINQIYRKRNLEVLLHISNVTTEDQGIYTCMAVFSKNGTLQTNKTYKLKVYKPHETFLNLRIISGKIKEIRPAGYTSVQWLVQVSTNINTSLQWIKSNGELLPISEKVDVVNTENSSLLIIRDLQLSDTGIYTLTAFNKTISPEIKVTLFVEEKPEIILINELNSSLPCNYEIGKHYNFEFYIRGYPLPLVEFDYEKSLQNYPPSEYFHTEMQGIKNNTIQLSEITLKLVISMNITYIGTLICKASNILGTYLKRHTVSVTDTSNDLEIRGPSDIVEGDNVTFECIASKYKYVNSIDWSHSNDSQTQYLMHIINNETELSYHSYLTIHKISNNFIGYINCSALKIMALEGPPKTDVKSFTIKLINFEVRGPSIITEGDDVTFECIASKYKYINSIHWVHSNDSRTQKLMHIINNETELSYHSYLTIHKISKKNFGYINCSAKRIMISHEELPETEIKSFIIKFEDPSNDLEIRGPSVIVEGNYVTFECIAPKYKYIDRILWAHSNHSQTQHLMHIINDVTESSYFSYLTIHNISKIFTGYINCSAKRIIKSHDDSPEIEIKSLTIKFKKHQIDGNDDFKVFVFCLILTILIEFLIMGSIIFLRLDKMWHKNLDLIRKNNYEIWRRSIGIKEDNYLLPYNKRLEIPEENIKLGKLLGSGAYGVVFEGTAVGIIDKNTVTTVAVKTVHQSSKTCSVSALLSELKILMRLGKHRNVVSLLGMCNSLSMNQRPMVILEYCRYGSIHQYMLKYRSTFVNQITPDGCINCVSSLSFQNSISENISNENCTQILPDGFNNRGDDEYINNKPLCTYDLICWSYQITKGLDYLANLKILHGDVSARNILLADDNIVKLSDFGLARSLNYNEIYKKVPKQDLLPVKWLAIESIRDLVFSCKSDVWSFGIAVWEMFSLASVPYPNVQVFDLLEILSEGYRMKQPIYANSYIYEIMLDCWKAEPRERPSFDDLSKRFGDLLLQCTKSNYFVFDENDVSTNNKRSLSTSSTSA